jgi:general stress protein YciG
VTDDEKELPQKRGRGFAGMSPERLRAISRKGGQLAHALGKAHVFDTKEAESAGRKGGIASAKAKRGKS